MMPDVDDDHIVTNDSDSDAHENDDDCGMIVGDGVVTTITTRQ